MTNLINQKDDTDCVIACFAMWLGRSHEEIMKRSIKLGVQPTEAGMWSKDENKLAESYGMFLGRMPYYGGLEGILIVPSLNFEKKTHAVFVDNYKIYDPQTGRKGKKWYKLGGTSKSIFPPYMEVVVDLKDLYSRDVFSRHINSLKKRYSEARKL